MTAPRDKRLLVVAIGGRALREPGAPTPDDAWQRALARVLPPLVELVEAGFRLVVTCGRGPLDEGSPGRAERPGEPGPFRSLDRSVAAAQGALGYAIQQGLGNLCRAAGLAVPVASMVTQVVVEAADPTGRRPRVPVGPRYTASRARQLARARGWVLVEEAGRGYRRVVPCPRPLRVVEGELLRRLVEAGAIAVAAGGGGVPVVETAAGYRGVEAVVEPDLVAECLAQAVLADRLVLLTDVERVAVNHGTPQAVLVERLTRGEARALLAAGEFAAGSMGRKVEAGVCFLEGGGREAVITAPDHVRAAIDGKAGTHLVG